MYPFYALKMNGSFSLFLVLLYSALAEWSSQAKLQQYGVYFEDFLWLFAR